MNTNNNNNKKKRRAKMNVKQRPKTGAVKTSTSLPSSPLKLSFRGTNQFNYSSTLSSPTTPSTSTSTMSTSSYCFTPPASKQAITGTQIITSSQKTSSRSQASHSSSPLSRQVLHFHKCIHSDCFEPSGSVRAISRRFANEDVSGSIECTSTSLKQSNGRSLLYGGGGYGSQHQLIPDEPVLPNSPVRSKNREQFRAKNSSSPFTYIETMSSIKKQTQPTPPPPSSHSNANSSICRSTRSTPGRSVSFKLEKVSAQNFKFFLFPF